MEKLEFLYIDDKNVKQCNHMEKFLKMLKEKYHMTRGIKTGEKLYSQKIIFAKNMYMDVHSSIISNKQEV